MAVILIGGEATDRNGTFVATYTCVDKTTPADGTGTISTVEIYVNVTYGNVAGCEVATGEEVSANTFTTRDSEALGTVTAGSKQTFSGLDMDVVTGDYMMGYGTSGRFEYSNDAGDGIWYVNGDYIPCTGQAFTWYAGTRALSIHGIGATGGGVTFTPKMMTVI